MRKHDSGTVDALSCSAADSLMEIQGLIVFTWEFAKLRPRPHLSSVSLYLQLELFFEFDLFSTQVAAHGFKYQLRPFVKDPMYKYEFSFHVSGS